MKLGPVYGDRKQYRTSEGVSVSLLKRFAENPKTCHRPIDVSRALQWGIDFENWVFAKKADWKVIHCDSRSTKLWRQMTADEPAGLRLLTYAEDVDLRLRLDEAELAVRSHASAAALVIGRPGYWAQFRWTCHLTGLTLKSELDVLHQDCIVDLKTCASASAGTWATSAERLKYHWQAAMYQRAVKECMEVTLPVVFVCCESTPPYRVECYSMSQKWIDKGSAAIDRVLRSYSKAVAENYWQPETHGKIIELSRPRFGSFDQEYEADVDDVAVDD